MPLDASPPVSYYNRMSAKPVVSFRLSPESLEGLTRLAELSGKNQSQVLDWLIQKEMINQNFKLAATQRERMSMRIEIRTKDGQELPIFHHNGELFCSAPKDMEYVIRVINDCHKRRLAVLSVDGINAVNGKDAGYDGPGWVLDAWQSANILGWYRNSEEVAAFKFSAVGGSYTAKTGRGEKNVGVIGVAVFDEKPAPVSFWLPNTTTVRSTPVNESPYSAYVRNALDFNRYSSVEMNTDSVLRSAQVADLGTEYGQKTQMRSGHCDFERESATPVQLIQIRYASEEVLRSWGVPVDIKPPARPEAFPANAGVQPPPGWNG